MKYIQLCTTKYWNKSKGREKKLSVQNLYAKPNTLKCFSSIYALKGLLLPLVKTSYFKFNFIHERDFHLEDFLIRESNISHPMIIDFLEHRFYTRLDCIAKTINSRNSFQPNVFLGFEEIADFPDFSKQAVNSCFSWNIYLIQTSWKQPFFLHGNCQVTNILDKAGWRKVKVRSS